MTLAFDANSKLVDVVIVADVSDEDHVGWQQIVADLEAEVWSTFVQSLCTRSGYV